MNVPENVVIWLESMNEKAMCVARAHCSAEDAKDAVQKAKIDYLEVYDKIRKPENWFLRVVRCNAISLGRKEARTRDFLRATQNPTGQNCFTHEDKIDCCTHEDEINLKKAISKLPDDERSAINSFYFEGKSKSEIADESGVNCSTICRRLDRGLTNLRKSWRTEATYE